MKQIYEFRIWEQFAPDILAQDEGRRLGNLVRVVAASKGDPLYEKIASRTVSLKNLGKFLFSSWRLDHKYSRVEIERASLVRLIIPPSVEPSGEECGTTYDESTACPVCGAGATQTSQLRIDFRKLPRHKDLAITIGGEIIVNQKVAQLLAAGKFTGFELQMAKHVVRHEDEPINFAAGPNGRGLLAEAERLGYSASSWQFSVWLNDPAQRHLVEAASLESTTVAGQHDVCLGKEWPIWYQLLASSSRASITPPTLTGIDPFDPDVEGEYKCPRGHTIGLNLLSEISIRADSWDGSDVVLTQEYVGKRAGLLRPLQQLLISQRLLTAMTLHGVKGFGVEVAHLS